MDESWSTQQEGVPASGHSIGAAEVIGVEQNEAIGYRRLLESLSHPVGEDASHDDAGNGGSHVAILTQKPSGVKELNNPIAVASSQPGIRHKTTGWTSVTKVSNGQRSGGSFAATGFLPGLH